MKHSRRNTPKDRALEARYGASFWDGVEREIEAFDAADFALFVAAGALPIEPRPGFPEALFAELGAAVRARFSN